MKKEPIYSTGQSVILEDKSEIILKERWDIKLANKSHYQRAEVSWLAYRPEKPDDVFTIKESEIPDQN